MFTYLGKFLVLFNAFAAVVVVAWAAAAVVTHVDAADAVDTDGETFVAKVKRLNDRAVQVQAGYKPELDRVAAAEARLDDLRAKIARRLDQSEKGTFYDIESSRPMAGVDPDNPTAVARVGNYIWTDDPARQILSLDGKTPLAGVDQMRKNLIDEQAAAAGHIEAIEGSVKKITALNAEVDALNARYAWLYERLKRHEGELPLLADLRVNWENRSGSLLRRRNQLLLRLEDLKGSRVGAVTPTPEPASPSAFTLTPNK